MSKLQEMLAEYRRLRSVSGRWSAVAQRVAGDIADYLLTLDASDLDKRDNEKPAAPSEGYARCLECGSTDRIPKD